MRARDAPGEARNTCGEEREERKNPTPPFLRVIEVIAASGGGVRAAGDLSVCVYVCTCEGALRISWETIGPRWLLFWPARARGFWRRSELWMPYTASISRG